MHTNTTKIRQITQRVLQAICLTTLLISPYSSAQVATPITVPLEEQFDEPLEEALEIVLIDYYRIELLLFRVLNGNDYGRLSNTINDYSDPIILEEVENLNELTIEAEAEKNETSEIAFDEIEIEIQRSEVMTNAWHRLSNSQNYHPVAYQQWDERRADTIPRHTPGGVEGTATRAHGEEILHKSPEATPVLADEAIQLTENSMLETFTAPEPIYKLDGRASFGQGRFLHIKLDFEFRNLNPETATIQLEPLVDIVETHKDNLDTKPESKPTQPSYTVFRLKQSRQIVPQKPELFDNEQFAALVYIEEISIPDPETVSEVQVEAVTDPATLTTH